MAGINMDLGHRDLGSWKDMMQSVTETNDAAFRELLNKKSNQEALKRHVEQEESMSILDFREERRRYAGEASSVVSASTSYADNSVYQRINMGMHPRIDVRHCLHPLSPDECDIYSSLVDDARCSIVAMPTHCITLQGDVEGFRFQCSEECGSSVMPICREMYFRHSMSECINVNRCVLDSAGENVQVLSLLLSQPKALEKLVSVVQQIHHESLGREASFECMPEVEEGPGDGMGAGGQVMLQRTSDCRSWSPEMPRMAGIFHSYVKDPHTGGRIHKLFVVVSGGCTKVSDRFFNISIDIQDKVTCKDFVDSQESWYLNDLNRRNNARIIHRIAREFKLDINTTMDTYSCDGPTETASCCTESTIHSLHRDPRSRSIVVTNGCMDPRTSRNGVVCNVHPTQGMCLFKGPVSTNQIELVYGGAFAHDPSMGPSAFPTKLPTTSDNYSFRCKAPAGSPMHKCRTPLSQFMDTSVVARLDSSGRRVGRDSSQEQVAIDESFLRKLAGLQWNRDNGMVELLPIAVVVSDPDSS